MRDTTERIHALVVAWTPEEFERSYAPGKWTARQILTHLAQTELALGNRVRMALTSASYTAQPFDQDVWMNAETTTTGPDAEAARYALRKMDLALFSRLSEEEKRRGFTHPEYGELTVDWIIHQLAGHDLNHLAQLEKL